MSYWLSGQGLINLLSPNSFSPDSLIVLTTPLHHTDGQTTHNCVFNFYTYSHVLLFLSEHFYVDLGRLRPRASHHLFRRSAFQPHIVIKVHLPHDQLSPTPVCHLSHLPINLLSVTPIGPWNSHNKDLFLRRVESLPGRGFGLCFISVCDGSDRATRAPLDSHIGWPAHR